MSTVHTIELHPLQTKAIENGANLLAIKMGPADPQRLKDVWPGSFIPYEPGDVLEYLIRVPHFGWRPCSVTVTTVEAKRPQNMRDADWYSSGIHHPKYRDYSVGSRHSVLNVLGPEAFDAIHGEGAYDRNDWYWFVTIETSS